MACVLNGLTTPARVERARLRDVYFQPPKAWYTEVHDKHKTGTVPEPPAEKIRKPKIVDFWSKDTPPFLIGPGTGLQMPPVGPGALYNKIENGDDCQNLSQLERRLQHPHTMKEEVIRMAKNAPTKMPRPTAHARACAGFHSPRMVHAHARQEKADVQMAMEQAALTKAALSKSAPNLGTRVKAVKAGLTKSASASKVKAAAEKPQHLPYPHSVVAIEMEPWAKEFVADAPPGLSTKGLLSNDLTYANNTMPGVCVVRQLKVPEVADANCAEFQVRIDHMDRSLAKNLDWENKRKTMFARAPSVGGSSQGGDCEVLPKQQMMTCGRASLCRPLPTDLHNSDKRGRYALADDSMCTSEHRTNFWWKPITDDQRGFVKQFVRPYDEQNRFREILMKSKMPKR